MAENTTLVRPGAGQTVTLQIVPDARLEFAFDQADADFSKAGRDLVFTFNDGAKLTLEGFYDNFGGNAQPPTFIVEGNALPGEAFLAALNNPDLMPLAGTIAAAMPGSGEYADAMLAGVGGVDRLDKLAFDGWGRNTEVAGLYRGEDVQPDAVAPEVPGGTFELAGGSYGMTRMSIASGIFEDWRADKHVGYDSVTPGRLSFDFTPTGTTVVDAIHLSGFDPGSTIVVGAPRFDAQGNLINGIPVNGPGQVFDFTRDNFDVDGVYLLPPKYSDHDMHISVALDLRAASSGLSGTMNGAFTIVVDAVADKPVVDQDDSATFFDYGNVSGAVEEAKGGSRGFDGKGHHIVTEELSGEEQVAITVPFTTSVTFEDYVDNSEAHSVLIQVPIEDKDGNALPAGMNWTCADAAGNRYGMIDVNGEMYFRIPVDNADIAKGGGVIGVSVFLTVSGVSEDVKNTDMSLRVGAMAEEQYKDGELRYDNNEAFDWKDGVALNLDVVTGGLKVTAGWASEGNNDAKHLGQASSGYDWTDGQQRLPLDADSTKNAADGRTNTGAPITIEVGDTNSNELITAVTLKCDTNEGKLFYNGVELTPDADGRVTISGVNDNRITGVEYRPNADSFSDADVNVFYHVDVRNPAGVSSSYNGFFIVVVDAVADKPDAPTGMQTDYGTWTHHDDLSGSDVSGKRGAAEPGGEVTLKATVAFPDHFGTENHYVLVKAVDGVTCDSYEITVGGIAVAGGVFSDPALGPVSVPGESGLFYRIPVPDQANGGQYASVDVSLTAHNTNLGLSADSEFKIPLGAQAVVKNVDQDANREYDFGNNESHTLGAVSFLVSPTHDSRDAPAVANTFEDMHPYQYLGEDAAKAGVKAPIAMEVDGHKFTYDPANSFGSDGAPGKATFSGAAHTQGLAPDRITEVRIFFEVDHAKLGADTGVLKYGGVEIPAKAGDGSGQAAYWEDVNGKAVFTVKQPANDPGSSKAVVEFHPALNSDNDFAFKYELDTFNPNTGEAHTWKSATPNSVDIVVDAVADRPVLLVDENSSVLTYRDGSHDGSAIPADTVELAVGVKFYDYKDGSEAHYILLQKAAQAFDEGGNPLAFGQFGIEGNPYTLYDKDGKVLAGGEIDGVDTIKINGVEYYRIPVPNDLLKDDAAGADGASVTMRFEVTAPFPDADATYHLDYGALAVESNWTNAGTGVPGDVTKNWTTVADDNRELMTTNNVAFTKDTLDIHVGVVESVPQISIGNYKIYENLTPLANEQDPGNPYRGNENKVDSKGNPVDGAEIKISGLHEGETTDISFKFDFRNGGAGEGVFDSAPKHADDVMRLEFRDPAGNVVAAYPIKWVEVEVQRPDGTTGTSFQWTTAEWDPAADKGAGAWVACPVTITHDMTAPMLDGTGAPTVDGALSLFLMPGYNYNSTDLRVTYDIKVTDDASGHTLDWSSKGAKGDPGYDAALPDLLVTVDAVAQMPQIVQVWDKYANDGAGGYADAVAYYGTGSVGGGRVGELDRFQSGGWMKIEAKFEFRDYMDADDSEKHYILVEKKMGWPEPEKELTIIGPDGKPHTVDIQDWGTQCFISANPDGSTTKTHYYMAEVENEWIRDWGLEGRDGDGVLDVTISMKAPSDAGSHVEFQLGAGAHETVAKGDQEISWDNNDAFVFTGKVGINFDPMGGFELKPDNAYVFENDTPNANVLYQYITDASGKPVLDGNGKPALMLDESGNPVIVSGTPGDPPVADGTAGGTTFTLGVSPHHMVDNFHFTDFDPATGDLYYNSSSGLVKLTYDSDGNAWLTIDGKCPSLENGAQFTFIPAHNYSSEDLNLPYTGTITNTRTGQVSDATDSCFVRIDAVAQLPGLMDVPYPDRLVTDGPEDTVLSPKVEWGHRPQDADTTQQGGGNFSLEVTVRFEDFSEDSTESHYVLVETVQNMYIVGAAETFSVRNPDGTVTNYWKVPVDNADIAPIPGSDFGETRVTVLAGMQPGSDDPHLRGSYPAAIKVGVLAEETPADAEHTYDNNVAFRFGGDVAMNWNFGGGDGGGGEGIWINPVYENDQSAAHLGYFAYDGGAPVEFLGDTVKVEVMWNADQGYFKGSDGSVYRGGTATLDANGGIAFRFIPTGHGDEDMKLDYTAYNASGESIAKGTTTVFVDAVATKPAWGIDGDGKPIYDIVIGRDGNPVLNPATGKPAPEPRLHDEAMKLAVSYGEDGDGNPYRAMGAYDEAGNEGACTVHVAGVFQDTDGSEAHYALVAALPGWEVRGLDGTLGEIVYLDGKAFFRLEMAKDDLGKYLLDENNKEYKGVTIRIADPKAVTGGSYELGIGLMAEETNYGRDGNLELTTDNNVSWTLGGIAAVVTSFVESTASVSPPNDDIYERTADGNGFVVPISVTPGDNDSFRGMEITASGLGEFKITAPGGLDAGAWELSDDGRTLIIHDLAAVNGANRLSVEFFPKAYDDTDVTFSWHATFRNTLSGDEHTYTGAPTTIVDAAANAPTFFETPDVLSETGASAALPGETTEITVKLNFADYDGSEKHYAVLEQGKVENYKNWIGNDLLPPYNPPAGSPPEAYAHQGERGEWDTGNAWRCEKAEYYDADAGTWTEATVTVIYDSAKNPYYAIEIPDAALQGNGGDVQVRWSVETPQSTEGDIDSSLKVGGISVETTTGAGGDKETTLDNNWVENMLQVDVRIGIFDTWAVNVGMVGELVEDDANGVLLVLGPPGRLADVHDAGDIGNAGLWPDWHEYITETVLTFSQEGARAGDQIGCLEFNGALIPVTIQERVDPQSGETRLEASVTLTFAGQAAGCPDGIIGYDPAQDTIRFVLDADNHNSGDVRIDNLSHVTDYRLGIDKWVGQQEEDYEPYFGVTAVADAPAIDPDGVSIVGSATLQSGDDVVVSVTATFSDLDGSENHYVLAQALPGWTCALAVTDSGTGEPILYSPDNGATQYFLIDVTRDVLATIGTPHEGKVTKDVSLVPHDYLVGARDYDLHLGGLAWETRNDNVSNAPEAAFTDTGFVTVTVADEATLSLVNGVQSGAVEGGDLSFILVLAAGEQLYTADDAISVTLRLTGTGDHMALDEELDLAGWTPDPDKGGAYTIILTLPKGDSSVMITIPVNPDFVLEALEGVSLVIEEVSLPAVLDGYVATPESGFGYDVTLIDSDRGQLELTSSQANGTLDFNLRLRNADDPFESMTAATAIMVSFVVDTSDHNFPLPDGVTPGTPIPDADGNTVVWTANGSGGYILTATLAAGNDALHFSLGDPQHTGSGNERIDLGHTLSLSLHDVNAPGLSGLDADVLVDGGTLGGAPLEYRLVDAEWRTAHDAGLDADALAGTALHQVDAGTHVYDASRESGDQIIIGTDGDDVIYASQGSDILVGGGGNDTFVWNTANMGQDEHAVDVIMDFQNGDTLHFEDMFSEHGEEAPAALDALLTDSSAMQWSGNEYNHGTFTATATDGTSISLSIQDTATTLTVSYQHNNVDYVQSVKLESFNVNEFYTENEPMDVMDVAQMLQEIIKVGGNT